MQALILTALLIGGIDSAAQIDPDKNVLTHGLFTIEYPAKQQKLAQQTLAILENAVQEFDAVLPVGDTPIHVIISDVPTEFKRYAVHFSGLDVSGLARPQNNLIVVKAPRLREPGGDYPGTLRHELVHLLLFRNIDYANLPQWLNEGLAMSLSNEFYWRSLFKVANMFLHGRIIPYRLLDASFYNPSDQMQFSDAYAQALSMTRFLRNYLGETQFWELIHRLDSQPFHKALLEIAGLEVLEFWHLYEKSLWKYAIISTMASGFFFQPAALLLIFAYIRHRRISRALYKRWEEEEAEEAMEAAAGIPAQVYWEELVEDPDAWKQGHYEDSDDNW